MSYPPLYLTVAGTSTSTSVTTSATLTRYMDSTFTTAYSPSFAPVIFNTSGNVDGIYDLTALVSNYMRSASNSGYYQLHITTSATTCGLGATQKNYYLFWAGPPVGNPELGHLDGSGNFVNDNGLSCNSGGLIVGCASTNTGSLTGVTMKLVGPSGVIFDGLSGTVWNASGSISSWPTLRANVQSYASFLGSTQFTNFFARLFGRIQWKFYTYS